jgi:hypothetical protein
MMTMATETRTRRHGARGPDHARLRALCEEMIAAKDSDDYPKKAGRGYALAGLCLDLIDEVERLAARVAELERDGARLDFIERKLAEQREGGWAGSVWLTLDEAGEVQVYSKDALPFRRAVDGAMKETEGSRP